MAMALEDLALELEESMRGVVAVDFPIGEMTTFRLGGSARLYLEPVDEDDLAVTKGAISSCGLEVLVIGRGSNLLISDEGFDGIAVHLGAGFNWIDAEGEEVSAGGATPLPTLARWCGERSLSGLEFGVGIPASVGGAVRMNAGGHGREISEVIEAARVCDFDGEDRDLGLADLGLSYRKSALGPNQVVVSARFRLTPGDSDQIRSAMSEISRWRRENQPGGSPNAGSMFKNPPGDSAGRLIDAAGLKGLVVGGVRVSEKHANFFLADEASSATEVNELMGKVRAEVAAKTGVVLEPEVRRIGTFAEWPPVSGGG